MLAAELDHLADTANGKAGFEGPRLIVEARVENTAVVPRLVAADGALLFYYGDFGAGHPLTQAEGGGQSDNPAADNQRIASISHFPDYRILLLT
jgi:hypothetical protein